MTLHFSSAAPRGSLRHVTASGLKRLGSSELLSFQAVGVSVRPDRSDPNDLQRLQGLSAGFAIGLRTVRIGAHVEGSASDGSFGSERSGALAGLFWGICDRTSNQSESVPASRRGT